MNHDILKYIDDNKGGRFGMGDILTENFENYFKQPFVLTNGCQNEPFDETNLPLLYNEGDHADIVIQSSTVSPPFATKVGRRMVVNIGSFGFEKNMTDKHYLTMLSIYAAEDGTSSPISQRTKVESILM